MTFANNTSFAAGDYPMPDPGGAMMIVAVVKATFSIGEHGELSIADEQRAIRVNDELYDDEAPEGSIRMPTDLAVAKGGTDVVVVGEAISPKPVTAMDVVVKVRDSAAPLRVHGERVFYDSVLRVAIGPAQPFERMPIIYEYAYGGVTPDGWIVEARNRAGVGVARKKSDLIGTRAPSIEHPAHPHSSAGDQHAPVGYGAIRSHWSPRIDRAGTFDEAWEKTRMPLLPTDYDPRANNVAHPTLLFEEYLRAGDPIAILGMTTRGPLSFALPELGVVIHARSDVSGEIAVRPPIDLVLIEPEAGVVEIAMRAAFPQGRGKDKLREIRVEMVG